MHDGRDNVKSMLVRSLLCAAASALALVACESGAALLPITPSPAVTSPGARNQTPAIGSVSFPQFDPFLGTLSKADLRPAGSALFPAVSLENDSGSAYWSTWLNVPLLGDLAHAGPGASMGGDTFHLEYQVLARPGRPGHRPDRRAGLPGGIAPADASAAGLNRTT